MDDGEAVAVQLGRPLRAPADVVTRCHLGMPTVTRVPPILDDGTPFPTLFWLTCPLAGRRIGRLESAGGVRAMDRKAKADADFAAALQAAHDRYAAQRDAAVLPGASRRPTGGVAGSQGGVKCLHAHYADHAAGNGNPVGGITAPWVEPLDCEAPCVVDSDEGAVANPAWSEPR